MGKNQQSKGTKMSIGEFIGPASATDILALPTAPKERGADDDGSFKRRPRRDHESHQDIEPSRSDADSSWRRGGGGGGFDDRRSGGYSDRGGGGFDDRRSGGYNDRGGGFSDRGDRGGGYNDRGGGFSDRGDRGGGYSDRGDRGGGFYQRGSDRAVGGFSERGGDRGGGFDGGRSDERGNGRFGGRSDDFRGGESSSAPSPAERPRLNLVKRSAPVPVDNQSKTSLPPKPKVDPFGAATPADTAARLREIELKETSEKESKAAQERERKPVDAGTSYAEEHTETQESAPEQPAVQGEESKRHSETRAEPAVINSRAAAFVAAPTVKRENNNLRESRVDRAPRSPPPTVNKRFEVLVDEERDKAHRDRDDRRRDTGPPEPVNSRFAAAADADRTNRDDDRRGPPPVQNSRFAAAAEADRSTRDDGRGTRFAGVNADRSDRFPPLGPPPVQQSRFAAAAAESERESFERKDRRRDTAFGQDSGPPPTQNSRFAAVIAADGDYVSADRRRGPPQDRDQGRYDDRRSGYDGRRSGYDDGREQENRQESGAESVDQAQARSRVADLLKPKPRTMDDNLLIIPESKVPVHVDNILKVPDMKEKGDAEESTKNKEAEETSKVNVAESKVLPLATEDKTAQALLLAEFISGSRLGDDLRQWASENIESLPSVEILVYELLMLKEQKNPDPECSWADPSKYGSALVLIVKDDVYHQMQVLWAIQKYCDKLGFPKLNEEYLVQSMFRAMYKFDLAVDDAFIEWKDDESSEHEVGKIKAVIQTVEWFAWLEQDEDDDEDYDEEDEEEE